MRSIASSLKGLSGEELGRFVRENFAALEKLRGRKRSLVLSAVIKLLKKARMPQEVSEEIAEMVFEELEQQITSEELALKCQHIRSLYGVVTALCMRFGEVHLELKLDEYAVIRVVFNEASRQKSVMENYPVFSSIVEFVNQSPIV